jgi:hypothetical protein
MKFILGYTIVGNTVVSTPFLLTAALYIVLLGPLIRIQAQFRAILARRVGSISNKNVTRNIIGSVSNMDVSRNIADWAN